jgi:hypothetical protein
MIAADHHRRLQLAVAHHFVEGQAQTVAVAQPTQQMRAGKPWKWIFSRAMSSQRCKWVSCGSSSFTLASVL